MAAPGSPTLAFCLGTVLAVAGACGEAVQDRCGEPGTACIWAGVVGKRGFNDDGHARQDTWLYFVEDVTFGPDGRAYLLDWNNHRVRRVNADDRVETVIGTDYEGDGPPEMEDLFPLGSPPGAPGTTVALNHPTDVEFTPDGKLVLAAWHNNKLRVWDPETGLVTVLAGFDYGFAGDGKPAYEAYFNQPKAVAIDADGRIYVVDQRNVRIRMIDVDPARTIDTMAGTGELGNLGDGGPAIEAQFGFELNTTPRPSGALALRVRELFVADSLNHRIRRIDLDTGIITCVAALSGQPGYSGDGGSALAAQLNFPSDIEFGPDGRLYVADRYNGAVRAIDLAADLIETVAGAGPCLGSTCVEPAEAWDAVPAGLPPRQVQFDQPYGIAFDAEGNLYVSDTHNSRVVMITAGARP